MRRSTQSEKVLKSISIALAAMVTSTTVMGSMGTMTVYAAEEVEDHGFDAIDENAGKYQDTETSGAQSVAEMNESVEDAKEALDNVNDLVTEINNELEKAENAANDAKKAGENATAAADAATEAADDAQEAVNGEEGETDDATVRADAVLEETNKYNDLVNDGDTENDNISDQEAVNAAVETIEITETETETENGTKKVTDVAVTVITEDGQETTENLNEYVSEKAVEAEEAKKEAYNALKDALAVDTKEVNDEVLEKVDAVKEAADKAQQAADDAKEVYDNAKGSYDSALAEYNKYAMLHGLALYDGTTDYGEEELNAVGITLDAGKAEKEGLILARSQQKQDITDDTKELKDDLADAEKELAKQSETIQKQEEALGAASDNLANAEKAADEAQAAVDLALKGIDKNDDGDKEDVEEGDKKGIVDFVDEAKEASDDVANYYVDPAIEAEEAATKDVAQKESDLQTAKENQAKVNAEQSEIIDSNTKSRDSILNSDEYKNAANTVSNAKKKSWHGAWYCSELEWRKHVVDVGVKSSWHDIYYFSRSEVNAAKAYIQSYNDSKEYKKNQDAQINSYNSAIQNAQAVKAAEQVKVNNCQTAYDDANNKLAAATDAKNAAVAKRDSIINDVNVAYEKQAVNAMVDAIKGELDGLSVDVNQVQFDQDLNAWANDLIRVLKESGGFFDALGNLGEAYDVRDYMDDNYDIGRLNEIFNTLALTQWAVGTEKTNEVMNKAIAAYRSAMKTDEEKMATVNAYYAYLQAADLKEDAEADVLKVADYVDSVATAQNALAKAQTDLQNAQEKYDAAADDLKDAKATMDKLSALKDIDLSALKDKIAKAEKVLGKAYNQLKAAQISAKTAEVYSTWANNLITDQEVRCYVRNDETKLENGDDGVKSEPVKEYTSISPKGEDGKVIMQTVPYELYNQYVSWLMKDKTEASQVNNAKLPNGKGIATGEEGTLGIVFWEINEDGTIKVDENGKATFYYENQDKPAGRYFVAYTLKYESDSFYHFDGVYVDVTKNEETGEDETVLPPAVTEGKDDPSPTFIDDEPVALAASVLGAERARTVENADEQIMVDQNGDVLGADRTPTGDVLGAGRPQTGDYTNTGIALFGAVASGMMLLGYGLKKKKENDAEEC